MLASFVAVFPTPFSAVHLYNPSSCLPVICNTLATGLLSGTRVHLIVGRGLPSPVQFSSTTSVSFNILSWMMWVMLGGSENNQTKYLPVNDNKAKFWRYFVGPYGRVCLSWLVIQTRIRQYFKLVYFGKKGKGRIIPISYLCCS